MPSSRPPLRLRLYVTRGAPNSERALSNLKNICAGHFEDRCDIEIVDVHEAPLRPLEEGILVTPTLVKLSPLPVTQIIGDLSQTAEVMDALALEKMM